MIESSKATLFPLLLICLSACSYPFDDGPWRTDPQLLQLVETDPVPGAADVSVYPQIDLYFDEAPEALGLGSSQVMVSSGALHTPGQLEVDLLARRLRFTPGAKLRANLRYRVTLAANLLAVDGRQLGREISFTFTTGTTERSALPPAEPIPSADDIQQLWQDRCVSCHGKQGRAGLDLSSVEASLFSLRGVQSSALPMSLVKPGNHALSYLMRKLLGMAGIVGDPMPPSADQALNAEELAMVAKWIDSGAQ